MALGIAITGILAQSGKLAKSVFNVGKAAVGVAKNLKWQQVIEGLPTLLAGGVLALFTGPVGRVLWRAALMVWLFAFVYTFMTQWVIYRLHPIMVSGLNILPAAAQDAIQNAFVRCYQVVLATQHFIPWEHGWTVCKWLIIIKLWLIAFHLCDWVFQKTRQILEFLF